MGTTTIEKQTAYTLADAFGGNPQTWRRYGREFIGEEPKGGQGAVRTFSPEEAFTLFLARHMMSRSGLSSMEVSGVYLPLLPWLEKRGYFPLEGWSDRIRISVPGHGVVDGWEVNILRDTDKELVVQAHGIIHTADWQGQQESFEDMPIIDELYLFDSITPVPNNFSASYTITLTMNDLVELFLLRL